MKFLPFTFIILTLCGCYNAPDAVKPMSWLLDQVPKDAPEAYKQGWLDGCESGMSSMTNTAFKTFYSFKQNKQLRADPNYYKIWKDTYTFCRHYAYGTLRQANMRMRLPNEPNDFLTRFMGTNNIFESGLLQLWGPGDTLKIFTNGGDVGGDLGSDLGMGGVLDFSGDSVMNGKGSNPVMNWDFND